MIAAQTAAWLLRVLLLAGSAAQAEDPPEEADVARRLEAGEVVITTREVPGRSVPLVNARALIEATPEKVWAVVEDCSRYKETMPRVLASQELSREGAKVVCRVEYDMPFPFGDLWSETEAVHIVEPGRLYKRSWKLRRGDFRENTGSWTLEPHGGGRSTRVNYQILSEPNVPLPEFILRMAQERTLPALFARLRKRVE